MQVWNNTKYFFYFGVYCASTSRAQRLQKQPGEWETGMLPSAAAPN